MKRRLKTNFRFFVFAFIGCSFFGACFEPTEGCLDSNASNFEVLADEDCCCSYPFISVGLFHKVGEEDHHVDSLYSNILGQQYRIATQSFYLSDMRLVYVDGTVSQVLDTLELEIPLGSGNEIILEDNFNLIKQSTPAFLPGMIKENGMVSEIRFLVGLNDQASLLIPDQLSSSHPLGSSNAADHYVEDEGYIDMKWQIITVNVAGVDTLNLSISNFNQEISVLVDPVIETEPGSNSEIPLEIDFAKWLEGIDFADDIGQIESQLKSNSAISFSVGE